MRRLLGYIISKRYGLANSKGEPIEVLEFIPSYSQSSQHYSGGSGSTVIKAVCLLLGKHSNVVSNIKVLGLDEIHIDLDNEEKQQ